MPMLESPKITIKTSTKMTKSPHLLVLKRSENLFKILDNLKVDLYDWKKKALKEDTNSFSCFESSKGLVGLIRLKEFKNSTVPGNFKDNNYSSLRSPVLAWLNKINFNNFYLSLSENLTPEHLEGLGAALAVASYNFKNQHNLTVTLKKKNKTIEEGLQIGNAVNKARFLVDLPPNKLGATAYKNIITKTFNKKKNFSVKSLNRSQLLKQGYNLISAVGAGNDDGPYLVHVSYKNPKAKKTLAGVGKGITFDSGGLDVKPSRFMRWMKKDMGGSASLFGIASWVLEKQPLINCDFIFCIAENSVDERSFRPGDIITSKNNIDIEIDNTDAEGRLALASGLNYLSTLNKKYDACFDVATLTGAIKVGLDDIIGGLFSNDKDLGESVAQASAKTRDPLWLMPLPHWSRKKLSSTVADYANSASGYGGALTAAEFLRMFAPEKTPWFHLDIYGWTDSSREAFATKGANGQSVQALIQWIKDLK